MKLESLTAADFAGQLHESFRVHLPDGVLEMELAEVEEFGPSPSGRNAFSLRFLGPPRPILPQAVYPVENAAMGPLEIFLVAIGPKDGAMRYEAIFT